jgi:hypothetical protein
MSYYTIWIPTQEYYNYCEISGPQGRGYEEYCLLGCDTLKSGRSLPTFQRIVLHISPGLKSQ